MENSNNSKSYEDLKRLASIKIKRYLNDVVSKTNINKRCLVLALDGVEALKIAQINKQDAKIGKIWYLNMPQYSLSAHLELRGICDISGKLAIRKSENKYQMIVRGEGNSWYGCEYAVGELLNQEKITEFEKEVLKIKSQIDTDKNDLSRKKSVRV